MALDLGLGTYDLAVAGKAAGQVEIDGDGPTYILVSGGRARRVPVLLKEGKSATEGVTGSDGTTDFLHLAPGTYRVAEVEAPAGYVETPEIKTFTVAADGRIDGGTGQAGFEDDYTKVRISKRDITDESRSGRQAHRHRFRGQDRRLMDLDRRRSRDRCARTGKYTLTEQRTPTAYDQAESIEFEEEKTGEVQTVTMYDSPISISGESTSDRNRRPHRQEHRGQRRRPEHRRDQGIRRRLHAYTIDFRSTSNTWTDEFTVEDDDRRRRRPRSAHIDHHAAGPRGLRRQDERLVQDRQDAR
ncbi:MAG: prealbumin-like fold domain-containing protein [Eggerthellaceae bacterium]